MTTAVTALIVAGICGVITTTLGQTVALEHDVLARIDDAGTRTIVVEDVDGRGQLDPNAIDRFNALSGIEWAVGFGVATDVWPRGLDGAPGVPIRRYFGALPSAVATINWHGESDTAIAGRDALTALGFSSGAGPVEQTGDHAALGVVGWMEASAPLEFLNRSLLTLPTRREPVTRVIVLARSASEVPGLAAAIRSLLGSDAPASVAVQTSDSIVQLRAAVQGQLGTFGRSIVGATLLAGLAVTALNMFGAVAARRRDFGRRRALGASRLDVMALVLLQVLATAAVGASLGIVIGGWTAFQIAGAIPDPEFAIAVAVLAVCATAVAALPPAIVAALRDPVRVLRVP